MAKLTKTKEEWTALVHEMNKRGMRPTDFAREKGLNNSSFYSWVQKINKIGPYAEKGAKANKSVTPKPSIFTRVGPPETFEVTARGVTLKLPVTIAANNLKSIMEALSE